MARPTGEPIVVAEGLHKRFGDTHALRGLDLSVARGTVCGVLGPNGAGKTTAVRILATLSRPDEGRAEVAGFDVVRDEQEVRSRIGLAGQAAAVDEQLTGRENLRMFGRLYHLGEKAAKRKADELLERFNLMTAADRLAGTYSGGMRRRLDLIASLIISPPVLFLDEPTTGLDPRSRSEIWASVRELVAEGTTVLLTTQYLEEADQLADDIVVIDAGLAIANGTPDELKATIGSRIDAVVERAALADAARVLGGLGGAEPETDAENRRVSVAVRGEALTLPEVVRALDAAGVLAQDVALRRPTLDEVFLTLTGKNAEATTETTEKTEELVSEGAVR
jgi:ABC-2 type transport system ATP-binding protein